MTGTEFFVSGFENFWSQASRFLANGTFSSR